MHHSTPLHDKLVASRTVTEILNHINPVIESVSAALRNLKDEPIKAARFANSVRVSLKLASTSAGVKTIEIGSIDASDVARTAGRDASKTQYREVTDTTGLDTSEIRGHIDAAKTLSTLNGSLKDLNVAYQILLSEAFKPVSSAKTAARSVVAAIREANELRKQLMTRAAAVSAKMPKEHLTRCAQAAKIIKTHVDSSQYSAITVTHFIASRVGSVVNYQSFVNIKDFTTEDGFVYPIYIVVLTTSIDVNSGQTVIYLTSLQDVKAPGTFPFGTQIKSPSAMRSSLARLMAIDGHATFGDRRPVGRTTDQLRKTSALGLRTVKIGGKNMEISDGVRVSNNKIYVRLVEGLSPKERTAAINELVSIVSSMYRSGPSVVQNKNAITYRAVRGRQNREWLEFSILPSRGSKAGQMTLKRINEVAVMLGMDESQKRALISAIK